MGGKSLLANGNGGGSRLRYDQCILSLADVDD